MARAHGRIILCVSSHRATRRAPPQTTLDGCLWSSIASDKFGNSKLLQRQANGHLTETKPNRGVSRNWISGQLIDWSQISQVVEHRANFLSHKINMDTPVSDVYTSIIIKRMIAVAVGFHLTEADDVGPDNHLAGQPQTAIKPNGNRYAPNIFIAAHGSVFEGKKYGEKAFSGNQCHGVSVT